MLFRSYLTYGAFEHRDNGTDFDPVDYLNRYSDLQGGLRTLDNVLVAAHTEDADYRPLSTYPIREIRFLHILGVYR